MRVDGDRDPPVLRAGFEPATQGLYQTELHRDKAKSPGAFGYQGF